MVTCCVLFVDMFCIFNMGDHLHRELGKVGKFGGIW